ncbi:MAG TPA: Hsp20/alpha crystallin family protein [Bryobacteraceae bacterium]|jgi:HSP20 family protein|nr:Hsp20/alpha crystallin family protein [Bryobacteraceae bacterium]
MADKQTPQTSSQEVQSGGGSRNQQPASAGRSGSGSVARRSFDPFPASPWEFFTTNPFSLMHRMSEEMDNFFNQSAWSTGGSRDASWSPAIEVAEHDGNYVVHAELPGLKPEEVKVELRDNALTIEGERQSQHEEKQGGVHRSERRYGRFYRSIPLPEGVNPDQVNARFDNGVLEITAPLPQGRSNTRQIPIQQGGTPSGAAQTKSAQPEATRSGGEQRNRAA